MSWVLGLCRVSDDGGISPHRLSDVVECEGCGHACWAGPRWLPHYDMHQLCDRCHSTPTVRCPEAVLAEALLSTDNPLLDEWRRWFGDGAYDGYERDARDYANYQPGNDLWVQRRIRGEISSMEARREACARWSFAVPTDEALDLINSLGPVVEVGAGTGYWAERLARRGGDVVAYDELGEKYDHWFPEARQHPLVQFGVAQVAALHADRVLFLCWPPYSDPMAHDALVAYEAAGGRTLVYVGEGSGGCTGDDDFHHRVGAGCAHLDSWRGGDACHHDYAPTWREVKQLSIPQWYGIHDYLTVYERID